MSFGEYSNTQGEEQKGSIELLVVFRVDASLDIGTGHVMRCLTLAEALQERGARVVFICRGHKGHLLAEIKMKGFSAYGLETHSKDNDLVAAGKEDVYRRWLGCAQQDDAEETLAVLAEIEEKWRQKIDWLVVDHYGLDQQWEVMISRMVRNILAVDDLAKRKHRVRALLDQTVGRKKEDYLPLVSKDCLLLLGPEYAMLRKEFRTLRKESLLRRTLPVLNHILISMGGVDKDNATGAALKAVAECRALEKTKITVIMGKNAPWLSAVKQQMIEMPGDVSLVVESSTMAQLMTECDLCIGACGTTSWERCCLGLPTIAVVLADNQRTICRNLAACGAILPFVPNDDNENIGKTVLNSLQMILEDDFLLLTTLAKKSASLVDGKGVKRVVDVMEQNR